MTPNPVATPARPARRRGRRVLLATLAVSSLGVGVGVGLAADSAGAASSQAPPTTYPPLPPFWDVGVSPTTSGLVDGQTVHVIAAAKPHEGGVLALMCSGAYGAAGVICEPAGGPFFQQGGFLGFDVVVKAVITDAGSGRRVDCRVQGGCTLTIVPAGMPEKAYSQSVSFAPVPSSPPTTALPATPAPGAAPPTTAPPTTAPAPAVPVPVQPRFTG
jgi:hypothetical protein